MTVRWGIRREGRAWGQADDFRARWELTPEKFEVYRGKLFWHENDRINLLALLLETLDKVARGLGRNVELRFG